jgi:hypothetical protein
MDCDDEYKFDPAHLKSVVRHVRLVQDASLLLGERLIESGERKFGLHLISRGLRHDQSKFHGIEWNFLIRVDDEEMSSEDKKEAEEDLKKAWFQHVSTNDHHPEYWASINEMPRICIAEMVCDWYARSTEMGTDLRGWIKETATKKYDMSLQGKAYKQIKFFVDMLLDPEFKPVKKVVEVKDEKEKV